MTTTIPATSTDTAKAVTAVDTTVKAASSLASIAGGIEQVLPLLVTIIQGFAPNLQIAGLSITKLVAIVAGLLAGAPDLVNAWNAIKAASSGGAAPTPEQWAALDAAADQAHADLQAAVAAYQATA